MLRAWYLKEDHVQQRLQRVCRIAQRYGAEYLIVGGYAVGVHGYPRYTGDLDIWLNPTGQCGTRADGPA